jgi:hypothetical protein
VAKEQPVMFIIIEEPVNVQEELRVIPELPALVDSVNITKIVLIMNLATV